MTIEHPNISGVFNDQVGEFPHTEFMNYLRSSLLGYGHETAKIIMDVFQKIGLPLPRDKAEYLRGTEGDLVLLERYGLVLRIERKCRMDDAADSDSPWIIKPLVSIDAGNAVIRICPGCLVATKEDKEQCLFLMDRLHQQGIDFLDNQSDNFGFMPIRIPSFLNGIPVVIDMGAVTKLTNDIQPVKNILEKEVAKAERLLYGPLRRAFEEAWPDKSGPADAMKMKKFWALCADYKRDGKLIAGWHGDRGDRYYYSKTGKAAASALAYEARLLSIEQSAPPIPAASPQPR